MEKSKKIIKIGLIVVGLGIFLTLLFLNLNKFEIAINRFLEVFDIKNLNTFFDNYLSKKESVYDEFTGDVSTKVNQITEFFNNLKINKKQFLHSL